MSMHAEHPHRDVPTAIEFQLLSKQIVTLDKKLDHLFNIVAFGKDGN